MPTVSPLENMHSEMRQTRYANLELQCPRCGGNIESLVCTECGFQLEMHNSVVRAMPPERIAYYDRFIREYAHIRAAEGRRSQDKEFYLSLPYQDVTGHNSHQWKIRATSYDFLIDRVLQPMEIFEQPVLDVGAGNGWMSYRLAKAGYHPTAVDLLTNNDDGLGAAIHFDGHLARPFPRFQAEASRLPFRDGQFAAVIFNASFHYAEDYMVTLREALRCLRPGGCVIITDTPTYRREESGQRMVEERHAAFLRRFGTSSDSIKSQEYVTEERLRSLEYSLGIRWTKHRPRYGWKWAMRPWKARLLRRREPSCFYIYVARKHA